MKTLSDTTLTALRDYLYQQAYDAELDDAHHFIKGALLDGYEFVGYRHMSQEDCLGELCDELEVDDVHHIIPQDVPTHLTALVHAILTELE